MTVSIDPRATQPPSVLFEHLTTAVVYLDAELQIAYMNPAAEALLAASARQMQGARLEGMLGEDNELIRRIREAAETGEAYTERELTLTFPAGGTATVDCAVTPLVEPRGPDGMLLELTALDRHLRISRDERLVSQQAAAREVVRGLAHEIKNPLGGLRGAAQLLARDLAEEQLREYTDVIITEADRLRGLVDALSGPERPPHRSEVNIHEVLEHVRTLGGTEADAGVDLVTDYDPSLPPLRADADQLVQATLNLVRNAVQALAEQAGRGEAARVVLRTRAQRQFTIGRHRHRVVVRVEIDDNGPGIPPELAENVFYPMVTGRREGTGLGLSIARELIHRHGGLLECESPSGGGTRLRFYLPLADSGEGDHG